MTKMINEGNVNALEDKYFQKKEQEELKTKLA